MKITIDEDLCCGHALCVDVAPELFVMGDDDKAHVLVDGVEGSAREAAEQAVRICPQMAIDLFDL